jgi:hypothetical protein
MPAVTGANGAIGRGRSIVKLLKGFYGSSYNFLCVKSKGMPNNN